jgi:hypothetical protein
VKVNRAMVEGQGRNFRALVARHPAMGLEEGAGKKCSGRAAPIDKDFNPHATFIALLDWKLRR